jgi:hypothetical protein
MTSKAAQFSVIERKGRRHGFFHPLQKRNTNGVNVGPRELSFMAPVAELNGVTVKSERRSFLPGIVFEVTFGTVFSGPVGVHYFLLRFTGGHSVNRTPAKHTQAEQGHDYPATAAPPGAHG